MAISSSPLKKTKVRHVRQRVGDREDALASQVDVKDGGLGRVCMPLRLRHGRYRSEDDRAHIDEN